MAHTKQTRANALGKMQALRVAWLAANGPCHWCKSGVRLETHHPDPSTKEGHAVWSWSQERREAELAKCIVLCHSCHAGFHNQQRIRHGSYKRYRKGCRCVLCIAANRRRMKRLSEERRLRRAQEDKYRLPRKPSPFRDSFVDRIVIVHEESNLRPLA